MNKDLSDWHFVKLFFVVGEIVRNWLVQVGATHGSNQGNYDVDRHREASFDHPVLRDSTEFFDTRRRSHDAS